MCQQGRQSELRRAFEELIAELHQNGALVSAGAEAAPQKRVERLGNGWGALAAQVGWVSEEGAPPRVCFMYHFPRQEFGHCIQQHDAKGPDIALTRILLRSKKPRHFTAKQSGLSADAVVSRALSTTTYDPEARMCWSCIEAVKKVGKNGRHGLDERLIMKGTCH
ncbi:hypothetical protein B0H19DRAFT_1058529 [Mycena capillaripes]|nr:hypothetical protein B0H19DRAFT_1058529 [Mycena capillaripes]